MNENMIHRLSLDLELTNDTQESQAMKEMNELYQRCFQPAVEDVIERYGSQYSLLIDNIDIDLGDVERKDIQNLLSIRLEEEIRKRIIRRQHEKMNFYKMDDSESYAEYMDDDDFMRRDSQDFGRLRDAERRGVASEGQKENHLRRNIRPWNMDNDKFGLSPQMGLSGSLDGRPMSREDETLYYLKKNKLPWYIEDDQFLIEERMELFVRDLLRNQWKMQQFYDILRKDRSSFYRFMELVSLHDLFEIDKKIVSCGMLSQSDAVTSFFKKICDDDEVVQFFCSSEAGPLVHEDNFRGKDFVTDGIKRGWIKGEEAGIRTREEKRREYFYKLAKRARKRMLHLVTASLFGYIPSDQKILSMLIRMLQMIKMKQFEFREDTRLNDVIVQGRNRSGREERSSEEGQFSDKVADAAESRKEQDENFQRNMAEDKTEEDERIHGDNIEERTLQEEKKEEGLIGDEYMHQAEELLDSMEEKLQEEKQQIEIQSDMLTSTLGEERLHIEDAGLIILHPFLISFFSTLKMMDPEKKQFASLAMQERAVHLLKCMTGYKGPHYGHLLTLEKMICGLPFTYPVSKDFEIRPEEEQEIENLLSAVCQHWKPLKKSTKESLQQSFILRHGTLEYADSAWIVRVEGSAIDILLEDLPWEISTILFPWLEPMIFVEWQME